MTLASFFIIFYTHYFVKFRVRRLKSKDLDRGGFTPRRAFSPDKLTREHNVLDRVSAPPIVTLFSIYILKQKKNAHTRVLKRGLKD